MDAFVSARVPSEKKTQVSSILRELGSTQTDLVNAAYDYVLARHELPIPSASRATGPRCLGPEEREVLERWIAQTTFPDFGEKIGDVDYKELIAEGKMADYEALS